MNDYGFEKFTHIEESDVGSYWGKMNRYLGGGGGAGCI